jgi:hemoglobin
MCQHDQSSLYHRLGGVHGIAALVDDVIDRLVFDRRLNANPLISYRDSPAGFKYLLTEYACWASGGPQTYTGRSMEEAHRGLSISTAEWEAGMDDLQHTLDAFAVPQREQEEIKAWAESFREVVIVSPPEGRE